MKIIYNCFYIHSILQKCGRLLLSLVKTRRLGESEVLTVTSSSTLSLRSKFRVRLMLKDLTSQESERRAGHPIKKKKNQCMAGGGSPSQSASVTATPDGHWAGWLSGHQYHHYP